MAELADLLPILAVAVAVVGAAALCTAVGWCAASARRDRRDDELRDLVDLTAWLMRRLPPAEHARLRGRLRVHQTARWSDDVMALADAVTSPVAAGRHHSGGGAR